MNKKLGFLAIVLIFLLTSCESGYGIWIRSITNEEKIKTSENEEIIPYEKTFYIDYYILDDVSDQGKIRNILTRNLNEIFPNIDNEHYYKKNDELITNLKVINESINEELKVDEKLYTLLKIGKEASIINSTYSIFIGNLNSLWQGLINEFNEEGRISNDPYYNENTRNDIDNILTCIPKSKEEIENMLELDDENRTVKFSVKEECQDQNVRPIIDLKELSIAYLVDKIKEELLENNYDKGLIYANGNIVYTLGDAVDKWSFALRDPRYPPSKDIKTMVSVVTNKSFGAYTIDNFSLNKSYLLKDGNFEIRRHDKINALTGYPNNNLVSIIGVTNNHSMIDLYFYTQKLFNIENETKLNDSLSELFETIYVVKNNDKYKVYSTSSFDDKLSVKKDFELTIIE